MKFRPSSGFVAGALTAVALAACGGGSGSDEGGPSPSPPPDPAASFDGERGQIAQALVSYGNAVEAGKAGALCREFLPRPRSIYASKNSCAEDPDNDARTGEAPAIQAIERIEIVPKRPGSPRIPDAIRHYEAEWELQDLASAYAVVADGEDQTAFGLVETSEEWRVVSRMAMREPTAKESRRQRFSGYSGILGSLGIVRASADLDCDGNVGQIHVDGSITSVRASDARQAILRSELVGSKAREVLDEGGALRMLSVDFRHSVRHFELVDKEGNVATIPVEGNGPTYYVNNYGGCSGDSLADDLLDGLLSRD